jgi:hypothetical protein
MLLRLAVLCVMQGLRLKNFVNFYNLKFPSNPPLNPSAKQHDLPTGKGHQHTRLALRYAA